jgi:hypothetical protein
LRAGYNTAKIRVLRLLAAHGWLTPKEIAFGARILPVRRSYTYLLRLLQWTLVARRRRPWGIEYAVTAKGVGRLSWLLDRRKEKLPK